MHVLIHSLVQKTMPCSKLKKKKSLFRRSMHTEENITLLSIKKITVIKLNSVFDKRNWTIYPTIQMLRKMQGFEEKARGRINVFFFKCSLINWNIRREFWCLELSSTMMALTSSNILGYQCLHLEGCYGWTSNIHICTLQKCLCLHAKDLNPESILFETWLPLS